MKPHDIIIHYPCHYELPVSNGQDYSFSIILFANSLTKQEALIFAEYIKGFLMTFQKEQSKWSSSGRY